MKQGKLYVCGTPLGNLDDITIRALKILREVDLIAAEDTRRTQKLLNYFNIKQNTISYYEHNSVKRAQQLLKKLEQGQDIALVSDAGMPCISDPGYRLVDLVKDNGIEVIAIPGPTALTTALSISGWPADKFLFIGFLPRKKNERKQVLKELKNEEKTLVGYESPHRIKDSLKDMLEILGDRKMALYRELTKKFEEELRGSIKEILTKAKQKKIKGELTFVIEGGDSKEEEIDWLGLSILDHVKLRIEEGLSKKKAIKKVAKERKLPKSEVYQIATKIRV